METICAQALQLIQDGDWNGAHKLIQEYSDPFSCQIHAYLHRIEGDLPNAHYWYQRAGVAMPDYPLAEELNHLFAQLQEKVDRA